MNRRNLLRGGVSAVVLCLMTAGGASSQTMPDTTIPLDPIVVTATQSARSLRDAPASVSVIDGETLRQRPLNDLADALQGSPGVTIDGVGLGNRGISIRGMSTDHTLILVDGARISNAASAIAHSDFELGWIPAAAIDRIEVVRGPMSSLYGSEALGGVVNIITRRPTDDWRSSFVVNGSSTGKGRGGDLFSLSGHTGGAIIPGVLALSFWGEHRGREALSSAGNPRATSLGEQRATTGTIGLTWTPDDRQRIDLSFGAGYETRWGDTVTATSAYRSEDTIRRNRAALSHEGEWGWADSRLRLTRTTIERENARSTGTPTGPARLSDTMLDGQLAFAPWGSHRVTFGGEIRDESLRDRTVNLAGRASQRHYAAFLQDEITLGEGLELVLGGRFDRHEDFGWEISPRAYLLYHASSALTFRGGIGKGFHAPTLKQLSPEYSAIGGGGRFTIIGNPDLQPETSVSVEAGVDYARDGWSVSAMLFQNDVSDLIQAGCIIRCTGAPGATWTYSNVDKARIRGLELGGDIALTQHLTARGSYGYLHAIDRGTGARLTGRPRHAATAELEWTPRHDLSARLKVQHMGEQASSTGSGRAPSYTMVSMQGDYAVTPAAAVQFGVENLTDERLADDDAAHSLADAGRRFFAGLTVRF